MNILFVQTGDYAEAWHSLARGEPETYRDQQASVAYVAGLAPAHQVTTLCLGQPPVKRPWLRGWRLWA